jgi:hypothetical protein
MPTSSVMIIVRLSRAPMSAGSCLSTTAAMPWTLPETPNHVYFYLMMSTGTAVVQLYLVGTGVICFTTKFSLVTVALIHSARWEKIFASTP